MPRFSCQVGGAQTFKIGERRVCAGVEQQAHQRGVAALRCEHERGAASAIGAVHIGAVRQGFARSGGVTARSRRSQCVRIRWR